MGKKRSKHTALTCVNGAGPNVLLLCFMDIQVSFMITGNFKRRKSDSLFGSEVRQLRFLQRQQSSWRPLAPL